MKARRAVTQKHFVLFILLAACCSIFLRYLVVPDYKLHSAEYTLGAGVDSMAFNLPRECAYTLKLTVPAANIADVINRFTGLINGDVLDIRDVSKVGGGVRLTVFLAARDVRMTRNVLTVSPWNESIKMTIANNKKIYVRWGKIYIGDFYLFSDKNDNTTGYPLYRSLFVGVLVSLAWILSSVCITIIFWCDPGRVCFMLFNVVWSLFAVIAFQRIALSQYGYPFMIGAKFAVVSTGIVYALSQIAVIFVFGRGRLLLVMRMARRTLSVYERRYQLSRSLVWLFVMVYIGVFFSLQVIRHYGFFPSMDLNCVVQLVYNALDGRIWETQYGDGSVGTYLRYHFQPIDILFVPLYYLARSSLVFYFVQTAVIAAGAVPVYYIASEVLRSKGFGVLFSLLYLLYPSVHNCTMYGFHFEELTIGAALFAFYALMTRKRFLFVLLCFLMLLIKENIAALVCMLGVYAFFKGERLIGACVAFLAAAWFCLCVFVVIPYYTPAGQITYSHSFFSNLVGTGDAVIKNMFINATVLVRSLFSDPFKATFLFHLFAPFVFLPLLAPDVLLVALPIFAQLLLSGYVRFYDITIFYQSAIVPCLVVAAIVGFRRFLSAKDFLCKKCLKGGYAIPHAIFGALMLFSMIAFGVKNLMPQHAPGYFTAGVYRISPRDVFIKKYLDRIPAESSAAVPMMQYEYLSGRRLQYANSPLNVKRHMPDIVLVNTYICWPSYGEYRHNAETVTFLEQSEEYVPVVKAHGFNVFEKRDAQYKTGVSVHDFNSIRRKDPQEPGACIYEGPVELTQDGEYDVSIYVSDDVIVKTTEDRGYDSFEYLPGFKDVAEIAQSFTPPAGAINSIWVYVRRLGSPALSLSLREDVGGKPADTDILTVCRKKGAGMQCKYGWLSFDLGLIKLDQSRKYWLVLSADGDGYASRYDIAAFNKDMKGAGYADKVLYRYYDTYGEWKNPYPRSGKTDDDEGNNIDGIVFRMVKAHPGIERLDIRIDGQPVSPRVASVEHVPGSNDRVFCFRGVHLTKGVHQAAISAGDDFQLETLEIMKKKRADQ
jgi:uncharacterized membrane protein